MADSKKEKGPEPPPKRRKIIVHDLEGNASPQIEMTLGDPIIITDADGKRYKQFRIA